MKSRFVSITIGTLSCERRANISKRRGIFKPSFQAYPYNKKRPHQSRSGDFNIERHTIGDLDEKDQLVLLFRHGTREDFVPLILPDPQ